MKRVFQVVLATALAMAASVSAAVAGGLTKIADNVYAYVDTRGSGPSNSFGANAGVIVGGDGIMVIDTLVSAKEGQRLLADIRKVSDKPIKYVVNTHWHLDHSFGNSEFAKAGATIIAQSADGKNLKEKGEFVLKQTPSFGLSAEAMEGTAIAPPAITFTDRLTVDVGGEIVELIAAGPSHTEGSLVVYLPAKKVMFAGDVLFTGYYPYLADGDIDAWIANLDRLMQMDVDKVVPGHGPLSTKKDLAEMKAYLEFFDREAKRLVAAGQHQEAVGELKKLLPKRAEAEWIIGASFQKYLKK